MPSTLSSSARASIGVHEIFGTVPGWTGSSPTSMAGTNSAAAYVYGEPSFDIHDALMRPVPLPKC